VSCPTRVVSVMIVGVLAGVRCLCANPSLFCLLPWRSVCAPPPGVARDVVRCLKGEAARGRGRSEGPGDQAHGGVELHVNHLRMSRAKERWPDTNWVELIIIYKTRLSDRMLGTISIFASYESYMRTRQYNV